MESFKSVVQTKVKKIIKTLPFFCFHARCNVCLNHGFALISAVGVKRGNVRLHHQQRQLVQILLPHQ
jgi:hypothetical protein